MALRIIYFVHGTTTDNEQGLATGWAPGELSDLGRRQAADLGLVVTDQEFDLVFCSDLKRAVESARLAFGSRYQIFPDPRLRECNYGDFTQKPELEFKDDMEAHIQVAFPGGESYQDVERRVSDFLEELRKSRAAGRVAIVAHQAPQLALEVLLHGKTWPQAIAEDWRKRKAWQPGWEYEVK